MTVLIVGSGHNALVAACYLARAGQAVEVLERDEVLGGAVSTVPRFPGHLVDRGSSAHIMIRHTGIVEELELDRFGLRYIDCDPWGFAPAPAGTERPPLVFHRDLDRTCASIEAACGAREAQAYRRFVRVWGPRSGRVMRAFAGPPGPGRLLRSFWGLDARGGGSALSREFLQSGDALLDSWFDDEPLKAALAWFGAQSGPPMSEPGTAPMVGFAALMHTLPPGRAVGGSGALTTALVARLRSDGGVVSAGDAVTELRRDGDGWRVRTESGRNLAARTVIAGTHILTTLDLLERGGFDAGVLADWRRRIRVGPGIGMVVRAATDALPRYPGAGPAESARGLQLLVSDRRQLRLAHGAALAGELPPRPVVLAMSFSALDPSIAPPGEHQLSLWAQWHPYRLADGTDWTARADQEADRIIREVDTAAPGFANSIRDRFVQTPADLERELGLRGGNVMHVDMSLDQMFFWRPLPELSGHRVPGAPGLYLTGASTHPGGGVSGASGRTAATLALRNLRRRLPLPGRR
ncbi:NAD(P)/FAD-dependent oxidoreductase [Nocardia terpenica]|uniref:phytoene desaturase family protein n=1 Tax=Nocardia terpenica TaxID=455432 RepID=UPI001893145E|nr:NAD(P)/FAD-dependent oxidoreductase [Nocardia terpenica]MBF6064497.1 NAD(P)/FAD-dependent oxidoreductase [Nocardia terpenica]MBF6106879.1 NAD(P)/FAD-dependent oxidoreductase [Nocardia terpenica]MBF6114465.1 NAD(P)/FAD-dependent oxidoreductase [Nocardia terpenica]MBF6121449.1 NAD(P)/FAD-dependent oxidoreductase [Nocardia terpenica]MBF6153864.1 NAD(P)/FAD-dependent oxidoreductase [Nocardia terpenica]